MKQSVSLPTYDTRVAWSDQIPGIFTVGYSRVGGTDVLGTEFPEFPFTGEYDDLSKRLLRFEYQRGRSDDLTEVVATQGSLEIQDADETYNPHNRSSPIQRQLIPLRPYRLLATGPKLVRLTTNGAQIDDGVRARALVSDTFAEALLRKRPLAYWRLDDSAGAVDFADAAGDPDALAYPSGTALTPVDGLINGDPGSAQSFPEGGRLFANHTDNVNPRAALTAIAVLRTPASWSTERTLLHKPNQWRVVLTADHRLGFSYVGNDDHIVAVQSISTLAPNTRYLLVCSWDGRRVRMWFDDAEVEVTTWA